MRKLLLVLTVVFASSALFNCSTPVPTADNEKEWPYDYADSVMRAFKARRDQLADNKKKGEDEIASFKQRLDQAKADIKKCQDDIYALVGATQADVAAFREKLGRIEGRTRDLGALPGDQLADRQDDVTTLENDLNALRGIKIAVLPEFFNRVISDASAIRGLRREKKITTYTVGTWAKDRDCLWNIAKRATIYDDAFMWPKIWMGNTDQIKNPDVIFPKQVLKIPLKGAKSSDEQKAERRYWRNKRTTAAAGVKEGVGAKK
jgi:nucleoid-associated protein YgaU